MKSEKSHSEPARPSPGKRPFAGCVELVPERPVFIEFVTPRRLWGMRLDRLEYFILGGNPGHDGKKTSPADLLLLVFETRIICLSGWRLELMVDPLLSGRVRRVHAEKFLGNLMIGEPWVSQIKNMPRYESIPL